MEDLTSLEDIFGDSETAPAQQQATPEAEPAEKPEAEAGQPRDESGRFASKAQEPAPQPAQAAPAPSSEPVVPPAPQKPLIDPEQFKGYIEEREKRQKLEAELKALRERVEQQSAQPIPNYLDDPEGYASHLNDQVTRTAISTRFDTSELIARQAHGDDTVQKAMDWGMAKANASQAFATEYVQQRHPIDWIVKAYKRDQLVSTIGDDADAWALKRAAELAAQGQQPNPQPSPAASPQPAPAAPPPTRSLASATSAGGIASVVDPGLTPLEQVFGT
jgi:hypothetical protein